MGGEVESGLRRLDEEQRAGVTSSCKYVRARRTIVGRRYEQTAVQQRLGLEREAVVRVKYSVVTIAKLQW